MRWTARGLTVLLVGVILAIAIGEGFNPLRLKGIEVPQVGLFWTTCIGMVVAWRWQMLGAVVVSLVALTLFLRRRICSKWQPTERVFLLPDAVARDSVLDKLRDQQP